MTSVDEEGGRRMQLDVWIPQYNLALEYQGRWEEEQKGGRKKEEEWGKEKEAREGGGRREEEGEGEKIS
jgi:hypothetical protein